MPIFIKPFLLGSIFGILLCLGIQWLFLNNKEPAETFSPPEELGTPSRTEPTPELNFYETLANAEVPVSEEAIAYEAAKLNYFLQAGSFRERDDADALRVQLILLNLEAEIQSITQDDSTWHRVLPFWKTTYKVS